MKSISIILIAIIHFSSCWSNSIGSDIGASTVFFERFWIWNMCIRKRLEAVVRILSEIADMKLSSSSIFGNCSSSLSRKIQQSVVAITWIEDPNTWYFEPYTEKINLQSPASYEAYEKLQQKHFSSSGYLILSSDRQIYKIMWQGLIEVEWHFHGCEDNHEVFWARSVSRRLT